MKMKNDGIEKAVAVALRLRCSNFRPLNAGGPVAPAAAEALAGRPRPALPVLLFRGRKTLNASGAILRLFCDDIPLLRAQPKTLNRSLERCDWCFDGVAPNPSNSDLIEPYRPKNAEKNQGLVTPTGTKMGFPGGYVAELESPAGGALLGEPQHSNIAGSLKFSSVSLPIEPLRVADPRSRPSWTKGPSCGTGLAPTWRPLVLTSRIEIPNFRRL